MSVSPRPRFIFMNPIHLVSFGFGTGLSPKAPGTVGTLVGFPLYASISGLPVLYQMLVLACLFLAGIYLCEVTGRAVGEADHPGIVWDEIVCFAMVLALTPSTPAWWLTAFVAFRTADILKPWPANWVDGHMKNGFGVMLDDLVAAIYATVIILFFRVLSYVLFS